MNCRLHRATRVTLFVAAALLALVPATAHASIDGVTGTAFALTAKADHIQTGDGGSVYFWGLAQPGQRAQYPGPTLIVNQGDTISITLTNELPVPVSLVFPGQEVAAAGGTAGLLTNEVAAGDTTTGVTYTFTATHAGTYQYHSGTNPALQIEMGLIGAIVVRPYGFDPMAPRAYADPSSAYDYEYLFLLSEMDPRIHQAVEWGAPVDPNWLTDYFPGWWFINGRNAPDTMLAAFSAWFPTQPYNCMPQIHPGEKLLMRMVGGGRDLHPFHHHGNHARIIARDGRMLSSGADAGADLSYEVFTIPVDPGSTFDALFSWTGMGMGWDIYGTGPDYAHFCSDGDGDGFDDTTSEWCADHGKPLPVVLPEPGELTFGGFYSGSPFLGSLALLPPGEGGLNPNAGFSYMWHSHNEKEMTNFDIFPGGMMTMLIVEPPGAPIM